MYIYIDVHIYTCIYLYRIAYICALYIHIYMCTHLHVSVYICVCVCVYTQRENLTERESQATSHLDFTFALLLREFSWQLTSLVCFHFPDSSNCPL